MDGSRSPEKGSGNCEQSFSTTLEAGSQLVCAKGNSVVILDTGATANLASFRWLARRNSIPGEMGPRRVATYPAQARFTFAGSRMGDVRFAADIAAGIAGAKSNSAASVSDTDIPALLGEGVLEAPGG